MLHTVKEIVIYPIKSLGGIQLSSAKTTSQGFEYDRRWMLLDSQHHFLTQRQIPKLSLFKIHMSHQTIQVQYFDDTFSFQIEEENNEIIKTTVWDDDATTVTVSTDANEWFSKHLEQEVTLVKIKDKNSRLHFSKKLDTKISVSLADAYPYLIIGTASLDELNAKCENKLKMNRFRPNIVVHTLIPHEEDQWGDYTIEDVKFANVKPCGRCNMITIDQHNAVINPEPLKILNQYRKQGNNVMFGMNSVSFDEGIVHVGSKMVF